MSYPSPRRPVSPWLSTSASAISSGVRLCLSFESTSALPVLSRSLPIPSSPLSAANDTGVRLLCSFEPTSSRSTMGISPRAAAKDSGVQPMVVYIHLTGSSRWQEYDLDGSEVVGLRGLMDRGNRRDIRGRLQHNIRGAASRHYGSCIDCLWLVMDTRPSAKPSASGFLEMLRRRPRVKVFKVLFPLLRPALLFFPSSPHLISSPQNGNHHGNHHLRPRRSAQR